MEEKTGFGLVGVLLSMSAGCSDVMTKQEVATNDGPLAEVRSAVTATFEQRAADLIDEIAGRTPEGPDCNEHVRIAFATVAFAALYQSGEAKEGSRMAANEIIEQAAGISRVPAMVIGPRHRPGGRLARRGCQDRQSRAPSHGERA